MGTMGSLRGAIIRFAAFVATWPRQVTWSGVSERQPIPATPVLSYAGAPQRWGIVHDRWPGGLRIVVPASRGVVMWTFGVLCLLILPLAIHLGLGGQLRRLSNWLRCKLRAVTIEIDDVSVRVHNVCDSGNTDRLDHVRPRRAVYEVRYVPHSRMVLLRAHGHEMLEFRPVPDDMVLRWIADEMRQALELSS
jgi:hypothetical protein